MNEEAEYYLDDSSNFKEDIVKDLLILAEELEEQS